MSTAYLCAALVACVASQAASDIIEVRGHHRADTRIITTGLPDPSIDAIAHHRAVDFYRTDNVQIGFYGTDITETMFRQFKTDFPETHGSVYSDSTVSISRSHFEISTHGGGYTVNDLDDFTRQNTTVVHTWGGAFELCLTPGTEVEITMALTLGGRSHPGLGDYGSGAQVEGLEGLEKQILSVDGRHGSPTEDTITLTGRIDEFGYLYVGVGSGFDMFSRGTELGGVPAVVDGMGATLIIRVIPQPGALAFVGACGLLAARRRR